MINTIRYLRRRIDKGYSFQGKYLYHKSKIITIFLIYLFKSKLVDNDFKMEFES